MAEGALLNLVGKISGYLGELAVEKVLSWWGVNEDLKKLDETMRIIKAVLVDTEKQQADGKADAVPKEWLRRLRKVLYQADDLFDKLFTVKQQTSWSLQQGNRLNQLAKKVLLPFSKSGPICYNFYVAGEIKSIREELDAIKGDLDLTGFNLGASYKGEPMPSTPRLINKWETSSFVNPENIVGREDDKNKIIEMLLSEPKNTEGSISIIPIVGFGGIGKTTLAQLVFNDDRVQNHFELTKWVWVPEKDNKKEVMGKIFRAFTDRDYHGLSLEQLQSSIRDSIKDKKYLLVLDDMWDESRDKWLDIINFLSCSKKGSKIIVTTRSSMVAQNDGTFPKPYVMQTLSDAESWDLFQKVALKPRSNPNLISIGKEIVKKCGNVPLAIRAIGSLLYGKDTEIEWTQVKNLQLSKIDERGSVDIMSLLKISYDQLPSQLKQCFAYCAFYKYFTMFSRNYIVYFWMAQGFIKPSSEDYSVDLEDVGHQYFEELLSRNFFQDCTPLDELGDFHFMIHDLMMDLAVHVASDENLVKYISLRTNDVKEQLHDDIRHLSLPFDGCDSWDAPLLFPFAKQMRSLCLTSLNIEVQVHVHRFENMLSSFISLRSLVLEGLIIGRLPDALGQLRHLRLLFIRNCDIKCLPSSINRLWNLQTLFLRDCSELTALPTGITRLMNLRCLFLEGCNLLTEMPTGFRELKLLQSLSNFIVGKNNGLDALADMKVRRRLEIDYQIWRKDTISEARKANLKRKLQLTTLALQLRHLDNIPHDAESLLEELQPPQSIKELQIDGYQGERLPDWMGSGLCTRVPNLIEVTLSLFNRCKFLSSGFSQLSFLTILVLSELTTLEYVEIRKKGFKADNYFPCLKYLRLSKLPQLRGWWREALKKDDINEGGRYDDNEEQEEVDDDDDASVDNDGSEWSIFPCLAILKIYECPKLISMPLTPRLQMLTVKDIHESILVGEEGITSFGSKLKEVDLSLISGLDSLVIFESLLKKVNISDCLQLTSFTVEPPTFIEHLQIWGCESLREIQGLHHLSNTLEFLSIRECGELNELPTDLDCLIVLQTLEIWNLPKLTALPQSIGWLPTLRNLSIVCCPELTPLPATFGNLTQLRWLQIGECPKMSSYIESSSFDDLLRHFTLLEQLILGGFPHLTALPKSIMHLPHLRELEIIDFPQLTVLPNWFTNLTALQNLLIEESPHLSSRCKEPNGEDLPLIRHIPNVILKD